MVKTEIVFIGTAPAVTRSVLLLPTAVGVVVESAVVVTWELLVSVAMAVAGGESIVLTVTAGMLLGETSVSEVVVFVVVFRTVLVICEAEMAGVGVFGVIAGVAVLLAERMATVFRAFVVVSKAVGVMLVKRVMCEDERVWGVDCVIVTELEGVVA